jgi:ribosomal protein S3AE
MEFKHSLEITLSEVEEIKVTNVTCQTAFKTMSEDSANFQTTHDKHSSKGDYLENRSRRINILIDGIEDVKTH